MNVYANILTGGVSRQERECTRKVRRESLAEARAAAQRIQSSSGLKLNAYHCVFCGGWHLTKQQV
jgi:hypothetical protein